MNPRDAPGVTFVVPVKNGARWLRDVLDALLAEAGTARAEILVVDDGSTDASADILARYAGDGRIQVLRGRRQGAAAALNLALGRARYDVICQIDQDVVVESGWLARVLEPLAEAGVAASQGWYVTPRDGGLCARVMGLDLERRYRGLRGRYVDHVCTGNTAYRTDALRAVAGFDESLGYGYDNDLSYRLGTAGYRLAFARGARSVHRWREGLAAYLRQQYGVGYGRLDLIGKHPSRVGGDRVSGADMIAHAAGMCGALVAAIVAVASAIAGGPWQGPATLALILVAALAVERTLVGAAVAVRSRDAAALAFAPLHLARDLAWCAAIAAWVLRRVAGRPRRPAHSM